MPIDIVEALYIIYFKLFTYFQTFYTEHFTKNIQTHTPFAPFLVHETYQISVPSGMAKVYYGFFYSLICLVIIRVITLPQR